MTPLKLSMRRVVDWTKVLSKCTPESRKMVIEVRSKNEELKRQILETKANAASLDWSRYEGVLGSAMVQEQQLRQKAFKPATIQVASALSELQSEESKMLGKAKAFLADLEKEIEGAKEALKRAENAKPVEQLTIDDVYEMKPELKTAFDEKMKRDDWYVEDAEANEHEKHH